MITANLPSDRYQLAPYVRAGFQGTVLYLGFGSIQRQVTEPTLQDCLLEMASAWRKPASPDEILENLELRHPREVVFQSLEILHSGHFLIPEDSYLPSNRYSRHALYYRMSGADPEVVQSRLERSHVLILGCGGIGNQVAASLATAGVGRITLVDDDRIELSNLTRQILFTEEDEGRSKAQTLKRELLRRNCNVQVDAIEKRVATSRDLNELPRADLIALSADTPAAVSLVNRFCVETSTPFLNVGYVNDIAVWGPFVRPGVTSCWACQSLIAREPVSPTREAQLASINQGYQAPSAGPINMMASAHALIDILRFLGGFGTPESLNRRIGIWTTPLGIETQECPKNPNCRVCGGASEVT